MMNATDRTAHRHANELWGITCYFNPSGYRRRLANYRVFRENLPVALAAIELAYGPSFELSAGDADILVQLRSGDVMWQKERLFNRTLRALPSSCRKIAWLDCDVIFAADDWAQHTALLLDRFALVQPFARVHRMPEHWVPGVACECLPPAWWNSHGDKTLSARRWNSARDFRLRVTRVSRDSPDDGSRAR
jgi:hypothetical protein